MPSGESSPGFQKRGRIARLDVLRAMDAELEGTRVSSCRYAHVGSRVFSSRDEIPEFAEKCPACGSADIFWVAYFVPEPYEGWAEQRALRGPIEVAQPSGKIEALINATDVQPSTPLRPTDVVLSARSMVRGSAPSRRWS
jgi:hypothetical protein